MELETLHAETEIISINGEIEKLKISKSLLINALEIQIKEVEKESHIIESKIDKSHVNRFNVLRNTRQNSVVAVKNNICIGCNMRIPTNLKDILKAKNEVIFCESCGSMLYYMDDKIDE
jgi:predicted  nucleic acid-binding Zn-ribbon protein